MRLLNALHSCNVVYHDYVHNYVFTGTEGALILSSYYRY